VTIYEQKNRLGSKFLVAGDGGFNLTHSESIDQLISRYTPVGFLDSVLRAFTNEDLRTWLANIGIPTYVGSSKRIFPIKGIKPIQVLKAIEKELVAKGVHFSFGSRFTGWNSPTEILVNDSTIVSSDIVIFALGGASWKVTGSDGQWLSIFHEQGLNVLPFQSSNCAFEVAWSKGILAAHEGTPVKNISLSVGNKHQKGELVITTFGLEGNAIYALSSEIQAELSSKGKAVVYLDMKPTLSSDTLLAKVQKSKANLTNTMRKVLKLSAAQIHLIKENTTKEEFTDLSNLVSLIKKFPISIHKAAPIDEAISTDGGLTISELTEQFELKSLTQNYCIGEMIAWTAPTGGYLIQACSSMGVFLARELNKLASC